MATGALRVEEAQNYQQATNATGATFQRLPAHQCHRVTITTAPVNGATATAIEVGRGTANGSDLSGTAPTFGFIIPANGGKTFRGLISNNSQDLWIRRGDQSNTTFTVTFETEAGGS